MEMRRTRPCPKCCGTMFRELGEYGYQWACFNCGKRISLEEMEVSMKTQSKVEANSSKQPEAASHSTLAPVPPKPKGNYLTMRYYDKNKEDILRDLKALGEKAMRKRWNISTATWCFSRKDGHPAGLAVRFGIIPQVEATVPRTPAKVTTVNTSLPSTIKVDKSDHLPAFPPFDSAWPMLTQIEWFRTYRELARR